MNNYFLSPIAEQDIDEIVTYIAQDNPLASLHLLENIYESMDILAINPKIGHRREDLTDKPVRFWPFKGHYLIIYKDCSPIEIVRILSGYRDLSSLLG